MHVCVCIRAYAYMCVCAVVCGPVGPVGTGGLSPPTFFSPVL